MIVSGNPKTRELFERAGAEVHDSMGLRFASKAGTNRVCKANPLAIGRGCSAAEFALHLREVAHIDLAVSIDVETFALGIVWC